MEIFFIWVIGAFIIGALGNNRKIGFLASFFLSLILSPLIGAIFVATSPSNDEVGNIQPSAPTINLTFEQSNLTRAKYKEAMEYYESGDLKSALSGINEVLEINPYHPYALFTGAKIYSLLKDKKECFDLIQRTYQSKHPFFVKALSHSDFDFIRSQPEFQEFVKNGYNLPKPNPPIAIVNSISPADELKKLSDLKESGVLTEEEFQIQKQKVLNS